jgi:hypothetical protein
VWVSDENFGGDSMDLEMMQCQNFGTNASDDVFDFEILDPRNERCLTLNARPGIDD